MKMTREETANYLHELLNNLYYTFIKKIENIEEEKFNIDGIINIFINTFDETMNRPLDRKLEENNIFYYYEYQKYFDFEKDF